MIRVVHPGSESWLFTHPGSRIQGSKRHRIPDPQHSPPPHFYVYLEYQWNKEKGDLINYYRLTNPYPMLIYRRVAFFCCLTLPTTKKTREILQTCSGIFLPNRRFFRFTKNKSVPGPIYQEVTHAHCLKIAIYMAWQLTCLSKFLDIAIAWHTAQNAFI